MPPAPDPTAPLFTRRFWLACAMHFCGAMGQSFYILFPLFVRHLGGTDVAIGLYAGLTGSAAVAARLPVGRLLDTHGRRRVLIGAGILHVCSWIGFWSLHTLGIRSAMQVVGYGLAAGTLFASYFTYASDIVPVTRRAEGIAMFGIWGMMPNGLAPFIGELLIRRAGFDAYFLTAAAFASVSLCISLFLPETTHARVSGTADATAAERGGVPWRDLAFVLWTTFMFGAAVNSMFTFVAPFADAAGRGPVGGFFLTYAFSAVSVRVLTGRLPDRVGLYRVLIPALAGYGLGVLCVPHTGGALALTGIGVLCGIGHGYAFPILNVLTVDRVAPRFRGRAVSWFTAMFDLGNTLANPLLGAVAETCGYRVMFAVAGCGVLFTAVAVWRNGPLPRPYGDQAAR